MVGDKQLLLSFAVTGGGVLAALRAWWVRRNRNPKVCDLRRCIVIVGDSQNDDDCINQRVSLKPHLIMCRDASINVIEVYGRTIPRRNGTPLDWTDNKHLRKVLHAEGGFHLMCIDDDGEIAMRVRLPVSEHIIGELIAGSTHSALPAPDEPASPAEEPPAPPQKEPEATQDEPKTDKNGDPVNSWSVGVLR